MAGENSRKINFLSQTMQHTKKTITWWSSVYVSVFINYTISSFSPWYSGLAQDKLSSCELQQMHIILQNHSGGEILCGWIIPG